MRKLFLHVGPPKTGTSAIQAYFRDNDIPGILYPETGQWPDGAHHQLVLSQQGMAKRGRIDIAPWRDHFLGLDEEMAASNDNVLISSEEVMPPERGGKEFIDALRPLLDKHSLELQIVIVIRHPLERVASEYNQSVKDPVTGVCEEPDAYLFEHSQRFQVRPLYEAWQALCRNVYLVNYHGEEALQRRFCQAILPLNQELPEPDPKKRYNPSMNNAALLTLLVTNCLLRAEEDRIAFFEHLRAEKPFKLWGEVKNTWLFSSSAKKEFMSRLKEDLEWIHDNGINLPQIESSVYMPDKPTQGKITTFIRGYTKYKTPESLLRNFL